MSWPSARSGGGARSQRVETRSGNAGWLQKRGVRTDEERDFLRVYIAQANVSIRTDRWNGKRTGVELVWEDEDR